MPPSADNNQHIGRVAELSELSSALDRAVSGSGGVVMLGGEPGIGKNHLFEELESIAAERSALVISGTSYDGGSTPPYWPWIQALRSIIVTPSPAVLSALEPRVGAVSEIVPEVLKLFADIESTPQLEGAQARFKLFDSINSFLSDLAKSQPIVVILDDLHWADQSSLDLLEHISHDIGSNSILIVGGYRDVELSRRHPLSATLASLTRNRSFQRIRVKGLNQSEVKDLVESVGALELSPELAVEIHERTEGNPFFASEVARDLSQNALDDNGVINAVDFRVPEGVREAIGIRLNRLSEDCNHVLRTAAVIGREFNFDLLSKLIPELLTEDLLQLLEIADTAVVIREVRGESGRYEFSHALIQQTLSEELTTGRRLQLHAQIVGAIEELYDAQIHEHYSELRHHSQEAETILGSQKLANYARLAGEKALDSYAWAEATENFEVASNAMSDDASPADKAAILFGIGTLELQTLTYPDIQRGWDKVAESFWLCDHSGDHESAIKIAVRPRGFAPFWVHGTLAVFTRALELVPPDSVEAGYLLWSLNRSARYEQEDSQLSREYLNRSLEIARSTGHIHLETQAITDLGMGYINDGDYETALKVTQATIELPENNEFTRLIMFAHFQASAALTALGRPDEALRHAQGEQEAEASIGTVLGGAWNKFHIAYARGDRDAIIEQGKQIDSQYPADWVVRVFNALGAWNVGEDTGLSERISAAKEHGRTAPIIFQKSSHAAFLALAGKSLDDPALATFAGELGRDVLTAPVLTNHNETYARVAAGFEAVSVGHAESAKVHYDWLKTKSSVMVGFHFQFSTQRLLGLLADTAGMNAESATHFESALETTRRVGYMLEFAWTCYDFAESLIRSGNSANLDRAKSIISAGIEQSVSLGLTVVESRLNMLSERIREVESTAVTPNNPANLTDREVEVLRLVASGRTNQQIADELVIALTTAAKHVANILGKTGSANRTEAATFANQHGITNS